MHIAQEGHVELHTFLRTCTAHSMSPHHTTNTPNPPPPTPPPTPPSTHPHPPTPTRRTPPPLLPLPHTHTRRGTTPSSTLSKAACIVRKEWCHLQPMNSLFQDFLGKDAILRG